MKLEEARNWARVSREQVSSIYGLYEDDVIVALDNRITELEAERDKLVDFCKMAINACPFPSGTAAAQIKLDEILAKASDKEDKNNNNAVVDGDSSSNANSG